MLNILYIFIFYISLIYILFYANKKKKKDKKFELKFNKSSCACKLEKFNSLKSYKNVFKLILDKQEPMTAQEYFEKNYKSLKVHLM